MPFCLLCLLIALWGSTATAYERQASTDKSTNAARQFTFSWPFAPGDSMAPRGGTTTGEQVTLVTEPDDTWLALQAPEIDAKERDRRAILAMAGPYRASFDFIETVGFTPGYEPDPPYQSWGTEFVYVVTNEPDFISLQHIMVIRIEPEGEKTFDPMIIKHWRQDWHYEARELHAFAGHRQWQNKKLSDAEVQGKWVQSVYQVDDSPRYAALGRWQHSANFSSWTSEQTWRPLPRREFSQRDDYEVLIGTNQHTITPTGWVQEEQNLKVVLDDDGLREKVLAREVGLARYERLVDFDWSPADQYWQRTSPFWAIVRDTWREYFDNNTRLSIAETVDGVPMFSVMFDLADSSTDAAFDPEATRAAVKNALSPYVSPQ